MQIKILSGLLIIFFSSNLWAHGYVGKRFFPSAITQDTPFINDKLAFPTYYTESPAPNGGETLTTNPKIQYAKTITNTFQVSATESYLHTENPHGNGFDDLTLGARYNLFLFPVSQSILSFGFNAALGGTGSTIVNAASTTTLSPEMLFAQGLGILPDSMKFLQPIGFSINLTPNILTSNYTVTSVSWGLVVEYSLPYLKEYVGNFKAEILDHVVPIIEFPFTTDTQGKKSRQTTGNIDPGLIFYGKYGQIGVEAIIPANRRSGTKIGGVVQFYLYLNQIFPDSIGKPIFS